MENASKLNKKKSKNKAVDRNKERLREHNRRRQHLVRWKKEFWNKLLLHVRDRFVSNNQHGMAFDSTIVEWIKIEGGKLQLLQGVIHKIQQKF
jgi:hypothetical protein